MSINLLHRVGTRAKKRLSRRAINVLTLMLSVVWTGFAETLVQNLVGDTPRWHTYLFVALFLTSIAVVLFMMLEWLDDRFDLGLDDDKPGEQVALSVG